MQSVLCLQESSNMKSFILCCFIAVATAAPQYFKKGGYQSYQQPQRYQPQNYQPKYAAKPNVEIVSSNSEVRSDGSFQYGYVSADGQRAQAEGYLNNPGNKDLEAEVIHGSYSYQAPDGTPIAVNYVADQNGFRASGAHIPVAPPIPEPILKSLAYNAANEKQGGYQVPYKPAYRPNKYY